MLLRDLQEGESLGMPHSRPMPGIGPRCHELRVNDENKTWRPGVSNRRGCHCHPCGVRQENGADTATGDGSMPAAAEILRGEQIVKKLKHGWVEGSAQEFLDLTDAEVEYIETRRAMSRLLKDARERLHLTQLEVATRLQTSQSRVAKMEKADPTVSSDLLLQALFRLGLKRKHLAKAI